MTFVERLQQRLERAPSPPEPVQVYADNVEWLGEVRGHRWFVIRGRDEALIEAAEADVRAMIEAIAATKAGG